MKNEQILKQFKKGWQGAGDGIWRFTCKKCGEESISEDELKGHKCQEKPKHNEEQILKKAIEKAVKNGWDERLGNVVMAKIKLGGATKPNYYYFIFNHDFAKAFFGELPKYWVDEFEVPAWKYHIQQLALAKDRLLYLSKFLK